MRHWNHLIPFITAARALSFRRAATQLGVTPGAISQNIAQFEKRLGVTLFYRTTRAISLTEDGARLFKALEEKVQQLDLALSLAQEVQREPFGTVKIVAYPWLARHWLISIFTEFRKIYPKINLKIEFAYDFSDDDMIDIVVRNGIPEHPHFEYRQVMEMTSFLVAAPSYIEARGQPLSVNDLSKHTQVHVETKSGIKRWYYKDKSDPNCASSRYGSKFVPVPISCDNIILSGHVDPIFELVLSGAGIAMIHDRLISDALMSGSLCRILPDVDFNFGEHSEHKIFIGNRGSGRMAQREVLLFNFIMDSLKVNNEITK